MASAYRKNIPVTPALIRAVVTLREGRNLTRSDLADLSGVSEKTIRNFEFAKNEKVQEKTLALMVEAMGASLNDLPLNESNANHDHGGEEANGAPSRSENVRHNLIVALVWTFVFTCIGFAGWEYSIRNATWTTHNGVLVAHDSVLDAEIWRFESSAGVRFCEPSPWTNAILLVGLSYASPEGGRILALERHSGKVLWAVEPDIDQMKAVFGSGVVDLAPFGCVRFKPWNMDGDGRPEIVVQFVHGRYYPTALCAVDSDGCILRQYNFWGHITDLESWDLDQDGKDEIIAAGMANAAAYNGAMVTVLDMQHFSGATVDSGAVPQTPMTDSCLVRVVFPQYPKPVMNNMSHVRLSAGNIQIVENGQGQPQISVAIGYANNERTVVFMDRHLRPLGSDITDLFLENITRTWPDSLKGEGGPGGFVWRSNWLATHKRFEAGHWPPD